MDKPLSRFTEKLVKLATPARKSPEPEAAPGVYYASFNRRMIAALLDSVLVMLLLAPPMEIIATLVYGPISFDPAHLSQRLQAAPPSEASHIWAEELHRSGIIGRWLFSSFIQLAVLGVITVAFWGWCSATPGKMACRIAVVDAKTLKPITTGQSILRFLAYFLSVAPLMVGFFAVIWDKKRQAWHDKVAGTVAVVLPKGKTVATLTDEMP